MDESSEEALRGASQVLLGLGTTHPDGHLAEDLEGGDAAATRDAEVEESGLVALPPAASTTAASGAGLKRRGSVVRMMPRFDFIDHFTLRSQVFRHRDKVAISGIRNQLIFSMAEEEEQTWEEAREQSNMDSPRNKRILVSVKRASMYGGWVFLLKFLYIYVVLFLVGCALVFCILIPIHYGLGVFLVGIRQANEMEERVATFLTLLAWPALTESLSILTTLVFGFLGDVWSNFEFFHTMTLVNNIVRDWTIITCVLLGPLLTFALSFMAQSESPITNALLSALVGSLLLFAMVMLYTIWLEVYSCLKIVQSCVPEATSMRSALFHLVKLRLRRRFALTYYPGLDPTFSEQEGSDYNDAVVAHMSRRKLTGLRKRLFNPINPQQRWTLDNVLKPRPILSIRDFSVLFLCCLSRRRFEGSVQRQAITSSFVCVVISSFSVWLVVLGYLIYSVFIPTPLVVVGSVVTFGVLLVWIRRNVLWMQEFKRGSLSSSLDDAAQGNNAGDPLQAASASATAVEPDQHGTLERGIDGEGLQVGDAEEHEVDNAYVPVELPATPEHLDMDAYGQFKASREAQFYIAEPKLWASVLLLFATAVVFMGLPLYGFATLGVTGYGNFFVFSCVLAMLRFVFNVHNLIETFGPRAMETLELPLFDFLQANAEEAEGDAAAIGAGAGLGGSVPFQLSQMASPLRQRRAATISNGGRRVYLLLTRMTVSRVRSFFVGAFALAILMVIVLVGFSVDQDTSLSDYDGLELVGNATHETHFVPKPTRLERGFLFPVCTLFDDLVHPEQHDVVRSAPLSPWHKPADSWSTIDFAFLSDFAYSRADTSQEQLLRWFGEHPDETVEYIEPKRYPDIAAHKESSIIFKVVRVENREQTTFVVAVRGTTNTYDLLADMQIWFPAMLFQWLRFVLPFGSLWNPVIPAMIDYMNILETAPSHQLSYRRDLGNFVTALKHKNPDARVVLTGHSLGGGVAMIVGALQQVPVVAISGPNSVLSRLKFGLDRNLLDVYTLNIIPRGDPVPGIDDQALLTENIHCRTRQGEYLGACHLVSRTLCELSYSCGSGPRPPIARCAKDFDYPEPLPLDDD
ncbi:Lipase_3 domain-containing protein [Durusdinium trenchii]|uniref:Lipase_3 domain-containing protein n=1 Tax=Durusdinium trenchii TaxID=1381693 RepID=A0ABP0JEW5_9DINO